MRFITAAFMVLVLSVAVGVTGIIPVSLASAEGGAGGE